MARRSDIEALAPGLRRYARGLAGEAAIADDLVQDAMLSALRTGAIGRGAALRRRLYAILTDFNRMRTAILVDPDAYGGAGRGQIVSFGRDAPMRPRMGAPDPLAAMALPEREALLLVAVEGFGYGDAADIVGVSQAALVARLAKARGRSEEAEGAALSAGSRPAGRHLRIVS